MLKRTDFERKREQEAKSPEGVLEVDFSALPPTLLISHGHMWGIQIPFSGPLVQFHHKTIDLLPVWWAKPWTKQLLKGLCQAGNELLICFWKGITSEIMLFIIYINELEDDTVKKIPSLGNAIFWSTAMSVEIMKSNKCKVRLICLWTKSPEREYFQSRKGWKQGIKLLLKFPTVSLLENEAHT